MTDGDVSSEKPTLTVLLRTGDRWALVAAQTQSLDLLLTEAGAAFEIVIYDSSDTPASARAVEALPSSARYVRSPETFDSAEESLCEALDCCWGEYVWILANDDGVEPAGLRDLLKIIDTGEDDLIVFNSRFGRDDRSASDGPNVAQRSRRVFYEKEMRCSIASFVERMGFFLSFSPISTVVVRRSAAPAAPLRTYLSIAPSDAHVAWLIEIGKDKRFVFVNRPLVVHGRRPDLGGDNDRFSIGVGEGSYSNPVRTWMWLRVLDALIARGALTIDQVRRTADMNGETRSHFGSNLAQRVLEQVGEMAQTLPSDDLALAATWLVRLFPGSIFLHALIADIAAFSVEHTASLVRIEQDSRFDQATRAMAADLRARAAWWRQAIGGAGWHARYYVETLHLYDIYDFGDDWVGARLGFVGLPDALDVIGLPSVPPVLLRASTYDELRALVEAQPLTPDTLESVCAHSLEIAEPGIGSGAEGDEVVGQIAPLFLPPTNTPQHDEELLRLRAELERQDDQLAQLYASTSWRSTAWIRGLAAFVGSSNTRSGLTAAPTLELGLRLDLGRSDADAFLPRGFSGPEGWGRWTDGPTAVFRCRHVARDVAGLLEVWPSMVWRRNAPEAFKVQVCINGGRRAPIRVESGELFRVPVPARAMAAPQLEVTFHIAAPKRIDEAPTDDPRGLGMGVSALRLSFVDDPPDDRA